MCHVCTAWGQGEREGTVILSTVWIEPVHTGNELQKNGGGRRESHRAQCWTQIIWSFVNQSLVYSFCVCLFLSRVSKLCWQFPVEMYLAQAIYITSFKGQPLSMKHTICNTVLYDVLIFCVCKYECKSIPSLEELQSPFQAALCERHGRKPARGQAQRVQCPHMVRGWKKLLHHKNQCSRKILRELRCAQGAVRICMCARLLL